MRRLNLIRERLRVEPDNAYHWAALADENPAAADTAWQGLLQARRGDNGYRDYPEEAVQWLGYVRTAQQLGFTLTEIDLSEALVGELPYKGRMLRYVREAAH